MSAIARWAPTILLTAAAALGQAGDRAPHIGYLYPAGGRQGTTFHVTCGGQYLRGVDAVRVCGEGVEITVGEYVPQLPPNVIGDAVRYLREMATYRAAVEKGETPEMPEKPELPDHPYLRGLEERPAEQLQYLIARAYDPKRQLNPQIAEQVWLNVTVAADAPEGSVEVRLVTPNGLTNPMDFQVGRMNELTEEEPVFETVPRPEVGALPITVNGQILPGEVDRWLLHGRRGQKLLARAQARSLIPYLADAVPGWFQAVLSLRDPAGREIAFADDYWFDPDPVLYWVLPESGDYTLEIRDAIYRGREDFVYRLILGDLPFITNLFPLGGPVGQNVSARLTGLSLLDDRLTLDTSPAGGHIRYATVGGGRLCNRVPYAVDDLPECLESEPNSSPEKPQAVELPVIVNGRIGQPGDQDWFEFAGRAGDEVVVEVTARRLASPLDSLVRLLDSEGKVLAFCDDLPDRESGLLTHYADSYLRCALPADGTYRVQLTDTQVGGSESHAYRLRLSAPRPDYALRVSPSTFNVPAGRVALVTVEAIRKDGYDGDIELAVAAAPGGFRLDGGRIPGGRDRVLMTLTAPNGPLNQPATMQLQGHATIDGRAVSRPAVPCDDQMQAFLWTSLVPTRECVVTVIKQTIAAPAGEIAGELPLRVPLGGTAAATVLLPSRPNLANVEFTLLGAPPGISLGPVIPTDQGLTIEVAADGAAAKVGYADNLVVEVQYSGGGPRTWLGYVPAIPFEVVAP